MDRALDEIIGENKGRGGRGFKRGGFNQRRNYQTSTRQGRGEGRGRGREGFQNRRFNNDNHEYNKNTFLKVCWL